jgi:hypothetical protein
VLVGQGERSRGVLRLAACGSVLPVVSLRLRLCQGEVQCTIRRVGVLDTGNEAEQQTGVSFSDLDGGGNQIDRDAGGRSTRESREFTG